jgi:hypothetical protein
MISFSTVHCRIWSFLSQSVLETVIDNRLFRESETRMYRQKYGKNRLIQYTLISAGMKFRNKSYGMVYRHIPAHFEHWTQLIVLKISQIEHRYEVLINCYELLSWEKVLKTRYWERRTLSKRYSKCQLLRLFWLVSQPLNVLPPQMGLWNRVI